MFGRILTFVFIMGFVSVFIGWISDVHRTIVMWDKYYSHLDIVDSLFLITIMVIISVVFLWVAANIVTLALKRKT